MWFCYASAMPRLFMQVLCCLALTSWLTSCDGGPPGDGGLPPADAGPGAQDSGAPDAGPSADTWASWAGDFFATYCTRCHSGGTRDYRTIDDVRRDQATIACGVSAVAEAGCGSFPPPRQFPVGSGPFPEDAERGRLIDWLRAGLPE